MGNPSYGGKVSKYLRISFITTERTYMKHKREILRDQILESMNCFSGFFSWPSTF